MNLTPQLLRDAADYHLTSTDDMMNVEYESVYSCISVSLAAGFQMQHKVRPEYVALMKMHGVTTDGTFRDMNDDESTPHGEERQSIRFMFLHFLALWLEDAK